MNKQKAEWEILFTMKIIQNFLKCGVTGWCLEVMFTSVESIMAGDWRLMGKTSLLMFPIYGMGALLEPIGKGVDKWIGDPQTGVAVLQEKDKIVRHGMLYMVLIFVVEYGSGLLNLAACFI